MDTSNSLDNDVVPRCDYIVRCGQSNRCARDAVAQTSNWTFGEAEVKQGPTIHLCREHWKILARRLNASRPCPTIHGWVVRAPPEVAKRMIRTVSTVPVQWSDDWAVSTYRIACALGANMAGAALGGV